MASVTLPKPRAVLFDWDNTLVETWPVIHRALNDTLAAMDHEPWTMVETRQRVRASLRDSFPGLFGDRWQEARDIFYAAFERHHLTALEPVEGALALLHLLTDAGLPLAVVSNKRGHFLRKEAEFLGWAPLFRSLVGAEDAAADKPAMAAVEMALAPIKLPPGPDIWFIGDTDIDMQCAHAAGMTGVLIGDPAAAQGGTAVESTQYPPRLVVARIGEIANHLA